MEKNVSVKIANAHQNVAVDNLSPLLEKQNAIISQLMKKGLSQDMAEELFQSALMKAISSMEQLVSIEKFENWFSVILKNLVLDHFRQETRSKKLQNNLKPLTEDLFNETSETFCQCVLHLIEDLNDDLKSVLSLRVIDGLSLKETADILDVSENVVKVRTHRAKAAMKKNLKQCCGAKSLADTVDCACSH